MTVFKLEIKKKNGGVEGYEACKGGGGRRGMGGSVTNPHGWEQLLRADICVFSNIFSWLQIGHPQMKPSTRKRTGQWLDGRSLGDIKVNSWSWVSLSTGQRDFPRMVLPWLSQAAQHLTRPFSKLVGDRTQTGLLFKDTGCRQGTDQGKFHHP